VLLELSNIGSCMQKIGPIDEGKSETKIAGEALKLGADWARTRIGLTRLNAWVSFHLFSFLLLLGFNTLDLSYDFSLQ